MCHTIHTLLQAIICSIQMLVRVLMTVILMLENILRMLLQTLYNFLSFMMQLFSLIPICAVFMLTTRLKCFMCGGGGPCPVNRGGACDCLMSALAIVIVFFIFRSTGILDKIFYKMGYAKAMGFTKFVPSAGLITNCSRGVPGGAEEFEDSEDLLNMGKSETEEVEEHEEITETEMLNYNETEKPHEKTEPEGNNKLEEKAGPDEKGEPEEKGKPQEKGEPEKEGKPAEGKPEKGEPEDTEKPKKKGEHEEKGKAEEKEKSEVLGKDIFKGNKTQHEANILDSTVESTILYYLV